MNNNFSDKSNNFLTSSSVNEGFAKESLRAPKVLKVEDLRSSDRRDSWLGSEGTPTKPPGGSLSADDEYNKSKDYDLENNFIYNLSNSLPEGCGVPVKPSEDRKASFKVDKTFGSLSQHFEAITAIETSFQAPLGKGDQSLQQLTLKSEGFAPPSQGSKSPTTNLVGGRFVEPLRGVTNHRFSGDSSSRELSPENGLQPPDKFDGFFGVPKEPNLESLRSEDRRSSTLSTFGALRDSLAKPSDKIE